MFPPAQSVRHAQRRLVVVYALAAFTTVLNITLLSPLLKRISEEFSRSEAGVGQLATVTAACAFVTALAIAPVLDRFPRRVWLRIEVGLVALASILSAVSGSFEVLLIARALAGVGGAIIIGICYASAADNFGDPDQRNRVISLISASATLGAILGLPVMTFIGDWAGWRWAVLLMTPLALLVFAGAGNLRDTPAAPHIAGPKGWIGGYRRVLAHRNVAALLGVVTIIIMIRFGWFVYSGAYAEDTHHLKATTLSLAFAVGGLAQIAATILVPSLLRLHGPRAVATVAAVIMAINLATVGVYADGAWTIFPFVAIGSASWSACFLGTSILLLDLMPMARSTVSAIQSAGLELGIAAGTAIGGGLLSILNDYESTFRSLAIFIPVALLLLLFTTPRHDLRRADGETASAQIPAS